MSTQTKEEEKLKIIANEALELLHETIAKITDLNRDPHSPKPKS